MIHYHGIPITPRSEWLKMRERNFCVSYATATLADANVAMELAESIMWDNGAFTLYSGDKGTWLEMDRHPLYEWLERRISPVHWGVVPDVIGGDVDAQRLLAREWPFPAYYGAAVWHLDKPLDYLLELADQWPRICFGSAGPYWQVGGDSWERRTDEAFNYLHQHRRHLPWTNMLRGLSLCGERWPFHSADSCNVGRNFKSAGRCPDAMAEEIDRRQNPVRWAPRPLQGSLI